jgi:3-oxoacyl-[acyl-carrier-protein] synthase-1
LLDHFVPELMEATGLAGFAAVEVHDAGNTAVFELLETAGALVNARKAAFCILLAVDSYLSEDRLLLLDEARRIRSLRNVDGFIPGEAAVAMVLEPPARARMRRVGAIATITRLALGSEPHALTSDQQSSGTGLTQVLREVLDGVEPQGMWPWVLCDMNGESYRAFEWALAMARLPERLGTVGRLTHPADCMGDVGAAFGGVLLALSATGFLRGYAPAARSVLWTASDGSSRAAALVEATGVGS